VGVGWFRRGWAGGQNSGKTTKACERRRRRYTLAPRKRHAQAPDGATSSSRNMNAQLSK